MTDLIAASDIQELIGELKRHIAGEVRFDKMTRHLYSTDASIYRIEPIGVVIPQNEDDVIAVIETANRHNVPVLPRGAGTSLAGQAIGYAIMIDFSKHMRDLLEINVEERWVRTQPGIILDELNQRLDDHALQFAPDPSTSNRSNVGGALGNNSCGAHSIVWGKTIDHVCELQVVLSNGDKATLDHLDEGQIESKLRSAGLEGEIYRKLFAIGKANYDNILARFPKIPRRVSGYNLDEFVNRTGFDMARFVIGSEGTLMTITEAKLRIVPRPNFKGLGILHFHELIEAMEATVAILEMKPAAVELIDSMIIRQARTNLEYSRKMDFIEDDPNAILIVEVTGDSIAEIENKLDRLEKKTVLAGLGYTIRRVVDPADQANVWSVRRAGLGLMMNAPGDAKPLPFVEDTAVAPEDLPEYVRQFDEIVREHGTTAGYYGHSSVGCLHIRPLINMKRQDGLERMVSIATQVSDLVLKYGGSMSGEHGDGLVRSGWIRKMFGSQLYDAFRQVKQAFDPSSIMNPGKIIDPVPMTENLRISPSYHPLDLKTEFSYSNEGGMAGAIEMCNGQGACRKVTSGTMCPSYMMTRDEEHSTRGRANALHAAISGALPIDSLTSERLYEIMDLCLECKACKTECPSNVDMTKLKYEFLNRYHKSRGNTLRNHIFGNIATLNRLGSFFTPLSNWTVDSAVFKSLLEAYVGIDRRRSLPKFARQTFTQWFKARGGSPTTANTMGKVILFADTFTNFNHPELGQSATTVLEKLGYQVIVPNTTCCGRPMLSKGMMDKARHNAQSNVDSVFQYVEDGAKLVGLEPSCILSFRDDYVDLLSGNSKAHTVARNTMMIEEFFLYAKDHGSLTHEFTKNPGKLLFHGHCHQKALVGTQQAMEVLRSIPGCDVQEIPSGCCGMAGAFGFEVEHYQPSMSIGELSLFPAIRAQQDEFVMVSDGVSCRQQIEDGTGVHPRHLVEILAEAL